MSRSAHGYAMAALLVTLNIMAILLTVAMPLWKTAVKREKEAELIFRGGQYARAVDLFRRKYANAYPPNLDILLNERFLRKKYKDPMTKDGEFRLLYAADQQATQVPGANVPGGSVPGAITPGAARPGTPAPATPAPATPLDQPTQGPAGARGGIMGVSSTSSESSLKLYNGRGKYSEWAFTPQTVLGNRAAGQGQQAPGANRPGVGPGGPGGTQRPGAPGTGFPPRPGQPGTPSPPRSPFGTRPPGTP